MKGTVRKPTLELGSAAALALALAAGATGCTPAGSPFPGDSPDLPGTDGAAPDPASDAAPLPDPEVCNGLDDDENGLADDGDVCPCPAAWFGGHVYLFCEQQATWAEANGGCAYVGYHLLTIDGAAEDDWADATADEVSGQEWWIGMNDLASEGDWVWDDGSAVTYTDWEVDGCCGVEPNDFFGEDCAVLNFYDETWNDLPCEDTYGFVCEAG